MRDRVQNEALKRALQANAMCEVGDLTHESHVTLCLRFLRSLGLEPGRDLRGGVPLIGQHAADLVHVVATMSEPMIAGWVFATEALVVDLFNLFIPHFADIEGVDLTYLTEHVRVDGDEHAEWMRNGVCAILRDDQSALGEILVGLTLAGQYALSVPGAMYGAHASHIKTPSPASVGEMVRV